MNIWEYLTNTRQLSWVDRKSHLNRLKSVLPSFDIAEVQKIYLLGYAEASASVLASISDCVQHKNAWCLKQVFDALPYTEDELGLIPAGNMFSVYLLLDKSGARFIGVVDVTGRKVEFWDKAPGFLYYLLFGKSIVYPPLSLLA